MFLSVWWPRVTVGKVVLRGIRLWNRAAYGKIVGQAGVRSALHIGVGLWAEILSSGTIRVEIRSSTILNPGIRGSAIVRTGVHIRSYPERKAGRTAIRCNEGRDHGIFFCSRAVLFRVARRTPRLGWRVPAADFDRPVCLLDLDFQ
jgi:hypothetical protein